MAHDTGRETALRQGFSLIELLVVFSIITVMVAMLLPAVQKVQEAASRTKCQNNIKNLGLAVQNYEFFYRYLPPSSVDPTRADAPEPSPPLGKRSWIPEILPMIEQTSIHWDFDVDWDVEPNLSKARIVLAIMICRSGSGVRFDAGNKGAATSDYAAVWRVNPSFYKAAKLTPPDDLRGAMTQNVRSRMVQIRDGTSNTFLLVECSGRPQLWVNNRMAAPTGGGVGAWPHPDHEIQIFEDEKNEEEGFVGLTGVGRTNKGQVYGFHPGLAQAAMADGSVRYIRNSISATVLAAMVTRNGGEVPGD